MRSAFSGPVYVVRDNIDTDQIIPAQFLNLIPTVAEEYEKLGGYALEGLPDSLYPARFVKPGQLDSEYAIVVAGRNFGCGSSREHAPIALGSATVKAEATGKVYPLKPLGDVRAVVDAGGLFNYARQNGMIPART